MKVLVTGSRDWPESEANIIRAELEKLPQPWNEITLIHGKCHLGGADIIAGRIAAEMGMKVIECPVDMNKDGSWPMAGHRRNSRMIMEHHNPPKDPIGLVLAFPKEGSRGTIDMMGKAHNARIPIYRYPYGMQEMD